MSPRGSLTAISLFVGCIPSAFAQLPKRVEKCLPYPTLAQEIRDMRPADPLPQQVRVQARRVEFDSKDGIPTDIRDKISADLRSRIFERDVNGDYLNELGNEIAEVGVIGELQHDGYFRATASARLAPLQTDGREISVVAVISAMPGPQYWAGDIRIQSTDGSFPLKMSAENLRDLILLQRGELFDVEKVRAGLRNLTLAYGREGYVDMTAEPDFQIDEAHGIINMVVKIDQQLEYRVGEIEILGVNAAARKELMKSLPKPGEVFDGTRLEEFFKVNQAILPPDASRDDVSVRRDLKLKTVTIMFDFRSCSPHTS